MKNNLTYTIEEKSGNEIKNIMNDKEIEERVQKYTTWTDEEKQLYDYSDMSLMDIYSDSDNDEISNIENDFNNMDSYIALEMNYSDNYNKEQLQKIAGYYNISYRKLNKSDLISEIVIFERDPENTEIVLRRKKFWKYIKEIKKDSYLSKLIIFTSDI